MVGKLTLKYLPQVVDVILSLFFFFLAVHVVQKKINWSNKEAIIVIADEQQKKRPSIHCAEKDNKNDGEKKKRKSREEAREDKSLSKRFKEGPNESSNLKRNERQEREFLQLNESIEKLYDSTRNARRQKKDVLF